MSKQYVYKKIEVVKENIESMQLTFVNGDVIELYSKEISEISVDFYDELFFIEKRMDAVVRKGFIKIDVSNKLKNYDDTFVYDLKDYRKSRKEYVINRCVKSQIFKVSITDENNWNRDLYGDIMCRFDGEFLIIEFFENEKYGTYDSNDHFIFLNDVNKKNVESIDLVLENCESIQIFKEEIIDMQLIFEKKLFLGSSGFERQLVKGFIRVKFDKTIPHRKVNDFFGTDKKVKVNQLIKRLCGKKGESINDICVLVIDFDTYPQRTESIDVKDVYTEEELNEIEILEETSTHELYEFIAGKNKLLSDGSVLISFGRYPDFKVEL